MSYNFEDPRDFDRALRDLEKKSLFEQKPSEMWAEIQHE